MRTASHAHNTPSPFSYWSQRIALEEMIEAAITALDDLDAPYEDREGCLLQTGGGVLCVDPDLELAVDDEPHDDDDPLEDDDPGEDDDADEGYPADARDAP